MKNISGKIVLIGKVIEQVEKTGDFKIFDELILGVELDPEKIHHAQYEYLKDGMRTRENLLHAGNGWGKTDMFAKRHIYKILKHLFIKYDKPYKTCQAALTLDQCREVKDRIQMMVAKSPILKGWFIEDEKNFPLPEIRYYKKYVTEFRTLKNKAQAMEGKEYGYIGADEVALERHLEHIREKVFLPRLRKYHDGQVDFAATPKGKNAYYRIMLAIKRAGGCVRGGSAFDNPHINHELLNYIIENWNELKKDQVIYGKFVDNSQLPFAGRTDKLFDENLELTDEVLAGRKYFEGWDLARGKTTENDMTFGYRVDCTEKMNAYIVQKWSFQLPWTEQGRENYVKEGKIFADSTEGVIRREQAKHGNKGYLDSTGIGDTLYEMLRDKMYGVDFRGNKEKLIEHAQACIDVGAIRSPYIPELADQMGTYMYEDKDIDTDAIMAFVVLCQGLDIGRNKVVSYKYNEIFAKQGAKSTGKANIKNRFNRKSNNSLI